MHNYLFDTELVRVAIVLGIVVSIFFYNRFGVTTGGAIVPGYLALFVPAPGHIVATLAIAVLTYWIVQKQLRPRLMLWGRHLFEAELLVALALQSLWALLLFLLLPYTPSLLALYGIGFLIPGIIAHDMGRQRVQTTLGAALLCTLVVFGLVTLIGAFRDLLELNPGLATHSLPEAQHYAYPPSYLWLGITTGILVSMALYRYRFVFFTDSLRAGGFVTAGYLALFANRPLDLLFILGCSILTYLFVTKFLMRQAILFGRSKMAAMFLTGLVVTWLAEFLIASTGVGYVPWLGFSAITPTVVSLLANDAQRQGPPRTLLGAGVATIAVLLLVNSFYLGYEWFAWRV